MRFIVRATSKVISKPRSRGYTWRDEDLNLAPPGCRSRALSQSYIPTQLPSHEPHVFLLNIMVICVSLSIQTDFKIFIRALKLIKSNALLTRKKVISIEYNVHCKTEDKWKHSFLWAFLNSIYLQTF